MLPPDTYMGTVALVQNILAGKDESVLPINRDIAFCNNHYCVVFAIINDYEKQ